MKKLVIITAVFAINLCASAATYNWGAYNDAFSPDGENPLVGTAYFFDANAYTLATITSGLESTGASVLSNALKSSALDEGGFMMEGTGLTDNGDSSNLLATGYIIVISSDEKNYWASNPVNVTITDAIKGGSQATFSFGEVYDATWTGTVASVPEPTSGLLMLLGVGGLALRRRRA